ncbi:PAS domain S-box protein, partial [Acinetobacter baumannii]
MATSDAAIFSKDLQGYITSWNTAAEQQFGYKANEIIGQPASIRAPRELHTEQKLLVDMVLGGEPIPYYETVRLHKSGRRI